MSIFTNRMRHGYANILNFSGREGKEQFWTFAGMHLIAAMFAYMVGFMFFMREVFARMQQFAIENPDKATVSSGPDHYSIRIQGHHPELMPDLAPVVGLTISIALLLAIVIGASATRRLHDSGWRGFIALIPLALLFLGLFQMRELFASVDKSEMGTFLNGFGINIAYIVSLIGLVLLLAKNGDPEENQFGPPPPASSTPSNCSVETCASCHASTICLQSPDCMHMMQA